MNLISSLFPFLFGKALRYPLITGLLIFSLVGMGWSYWQGRSGANERFEKARAEAILKDTRENQKLSEDAQRLVERAKDATDKRNEKTDAEIETIESLSRNQCLDVRLVDLGLQ